MADRPAFGTAPIRCGRTRCKWRGVETDLKKVPSAMGGLRCLNNVCPTCGCDSYIFMTDREIKAWQAARRAQASAEPLTDWEIDGLKKGPSQSYRQFARDIESAVMNKHGITAAKESNLGAVAREGDQ